MSHKLRLGLDLDGCVYKWANTAIYLLNTHRDTNLSLEKWDRWDYLKESVTKEDFNWLWDEAVKGHGLFRYGSIYKGTREFLQETERLFDIVVITSRPQNATQDTLAWLSYQKLPTNEVHILGQGKKSSVTPQCDVYIDDAIHNCQDLIENTKGLVVMPDRPWNQGYTSDEITRFHRAYSVAHMKSILESYHNIQVSKNE